MKHDCIKYKDSKPDAALLEDSEDNIYASYFHQRQCRGEDLVWIQIDNFTEI